jgi:hypothetical protein
MDAPTARLFSKFKELDDDEKQMFLRVLFEYLLSYDSLHPAEKHPAPAKVTNPQP